VSKPAAGRIISTVGGLRQHARGTLDDPSFAPWPGSLARAGVEMEHGTIGAVEVYCDDLGNCGTAPSRRRREQKAVRQIQAEIAGKRWRQYGRRNLHLAVGQAQASQLSVVRED